MTDDRTRDGNWDREQWKGEGQGGEAGDDRTTESPADATTGDRWNKTQWVGDQGGGAPAPQDPDTMPEGESRLSGDRHTPGEEHWADRDR